MTISAVPGELDAILINRFLLREIKQGGGTGGAGGPPGAEQEEGRPDAAPAPARGAGPGLRGRAGSRHAGKGSGPGGRRPRRAAHGGGGGGPRPPRGRRRSKFGKGEGGPGAGGRGAAGDPESPDGGAVLGCVGGGGATGTIRITIPFA